MTMSNKDPDSRRFSMSIALTLLTALLLGPLAALHCVYELPMNGKLEDLNFQ
jgi:hypothetical protein